MKYLTLRVLTLALFLLCFVNVAFAFPQLNGYVADGADVLDDEKVEVAAEELAAATGAIPIALTFNENDGLSTEEYLSQFLETNGYGRQQFDVNGNPTSGNLNGAIIIIAINYEDRDLRVVYGDMWTEELDGNIDTILDQSMVGYAMGDPTTGFVGTFKAIHDAIDPPAARFWRANGVMIVASLFSLTLLIILLFWLMPRVIRLNKTKSAKQLLLTEWKHTQQLFETGLRYCSQISNLISREFPERDGNLTVDKTKKSQQVENLERRVNFVLNTETNLLTSPENLSALVNSAANLMPEMRSVKEWVEQRQQELTKFTHQTNASSGSLEAAEAAMRGLEEFYDQRKEGSHYLVNRDQAFTSLSARLAEASQLVRYDQMLISGGQIAASLLADIEAFKNALEAFIGAEKIAQEVTNDLNDMIAPYQVELPTVSQILSQPIASLMVAISDLHDDNEYDDAFASAENARGDFLAAKNASQLLIQALTARNRSMEALNAIFNEGFRNQVQADLAEAEEDLTKASASLVAGTFDEVGRCAEELVSDINRALQNMRALVALRDSNTSKLRSLSSSVTSARHRLDKSINPVWLRLKAEFGRPDYEPVEGNFKTADGIVCELFDNPADENDLASRAGNLNSMEVQDFQGAEKAIAKVQRELVRAGEMMDALQARHDLAMRARGTHLNALANANTRIQEAVAIKNEKDEWVSDSVDSLIAKAVRFHQDGEQAAASKSYIAALEAATNATRLAEKAKTSASGQISEIKTAFDQQKLVQEKARRAIQNADEAVSNEQDSVIQPSTIRTLRTAKSIFAEAENQAASIAGITDRLLLSFLQGSINKYEDAFEAAKEASDLLSEDQLRRRRLVGSANEAIADAIAAIDAAARMCADRRAGGAGTSSLEKARQLMPSGRLNPSATTSEIEAIENRANQVKDLAYLAKSQAKQAIDNYEAAEARQAAIRAQAESVRRSTAYQSTTRPVSSSPRSTSSYSTPKLPSRPAQSSPRSSSPSRPSSSPRSSAPRTGGSASRSNIGRGGASSKKKF